MTVVLAVMATPWRWGERDCCASACEVFRRLHGFDPMADVRGLCGSRAEASAFVAAEGGMAAMAARRLAAAGLVEATDPRPGDLGLSAERPEGVVLCVMVEGGKWAAKTARGFALIDGVERAWTYNGSIRSQFLGSFSTLSP